MRTKDELWQVLLATTRMPWIGGDPVEIEGRRYIDGALSCPIRSTRRPAPVRRTCWRCRPARSACREPGAEGDRERDRAPSAADEPRPRPALAAARGRVRGAHGPHRRALAQRRRPAVRARPAAAGGHAGRLPARAAARDGLRAAAMAAERLVDEALGPRERLPESAAMGVLDDAPGSVSGWPALGRPAYINVGRDLGADRSVDALRARTHAVLDAARAAGVTYSTRRGPTAGRRSSSAGWLAARRRARRVDRRLQVGLSVHADWRMRPTSTRSRTSRRAPALASSPRPGRTSGRT